MIVVLDTSAAVEVVLRKKGASVLAQHIANADMVIAPDLFISEITNVFWKYYQFAGLPMEQCEAALGNAMSLPDDFVSSTDLYEEAYAMACLTKSTAYDMFFLILARRCNAFLMTIDLELKRHAKKHSVRVIA